MAGPRSHIQPLAVRGRIRRAQPRGLPLVNMSFNELPWPPHEHVLETIKDVASRANCYGDPTCVALREALADAHGLDPDTIVCGNGSEEMLDVIGRCFARPGEQILIPQFGYIQFPIVANRVGATLVKAAERQFCTDIDALLAAVTEKTRILFLANPNNPTGTMVGIDELTELARRLRKDVLLAIDLAYGEFAGPDYCAAVHDLVLRHGNIMATRTFSKAYGLAGLRVGWCHTPADLVPALYAARGMGTVNAAAQAAALASLRRPDIVAQRIDTIVAERQRVAKACRDIDLHVVPSQTNFLMAGIPGGDSEAADALADHLFDTAGILVNRIREDGLRGSIRFSLSLPEHNDLLLRAIRAFMTVR